MQAALEAPLRQGGCGLGEGAPTPATQPQSARVAGPKPADCGRKIFAHREDPPSPTKWGSGYLSPPCIFLPAVSPFLLSCEALGGRSLWAQKEP